MRNGLEAYAASDSRFLRFRDYFEEHCNSQHTEPTTFDTPVYDELLALLEDVAKHNSEEQNLKAATNNRSITTNHLVGDDPS